MIRFTWNSFDHLTYYNDDFFAWYAKLIFGLLALLYFSCFSIMICRQFPPVRLPGPLIVLHGFVTTNYPQYEEQLLQFYNQHTRLFYIFQDPNIRLDFTESIKYICSYANLCHFPSDLLKVMIALHLDYFLVFNNANFKKAARVYGYSYKEKSFASSSSG